MDPWSLYHEQPHVLAGLLLLGLMAGGFGGLLGVGGSIVMLPGMVILIGIQSGWEQHVFQAAAMVVNVAVAWPAAKRHRASGVMQPEVLRVMLPSAVVAVVLGVALSNLPLFRGDSSRYLRWALAGFMVYTAVRNLTKLRAALGKTKREASRSPSGAEIKTERADSDTPPQPPRRASSATVGGAMGVVAGLLGIGGGAVAVPMQQVLLRLPLKTAIAHSSAVMLWSAAIGAVMKSATLSQHATPEHPLSWSTALPLALVLAPSAMVGSRVGAMLTHRLPLPAVRLAFIFLMLTAAWKMVVP